LRGKASECEGKGGKKKKGRQDLMLPAPPGLLLAEGTGALGKKKPTGKIVLWRGEKRDGARITGHWGFGRGQGRWMRGKFGGGESLRLLEKGGLGGGRENSLRLPDVDGIATSNFRKSRTS